MNQNEERKSAAETGGNKFCWSRYTWIAHIELWPLQSIGFADADSDAYIDCYPDVNANTDANADPYNRSLGGNA